MHLNSKRIQFTIAAAAVLVSIILFGGAGSAVYAARSRDALNRVKTSIEQAPATAAEEVEIVGKIEAISGDLLTISGQVIKISDLTEVKGSLAVGDEVKVHASADSTGQLVASEIEPALPGMDDDQDTDDTEVVDDQDADETENVDDQDTEETENDDDQDQSVNEEDDNSSMDDDGGDSSDSDGNSQDNDHTGGDDDSGGSHSDEGGSDD